MTGAISTPQTLTMKEFVLNGLTVGIFKSNDDNTKLTISGFDYKWRDLEVGEVILLASSKEPDFGSSYEVIRVDRPMSVKDQFFVDLEWRSKKDLQAMSQNKRLFRRICEWC